MKQGNLFTEFEQFEGDPRLLARRDDPPTSQEAADYVAADLGRRQAIALRLVEQHPDRTATELASLGGFADPRVVNRRLGELERLGLVMRGVARKCEETGRNAATWTALTE